MIKVAIAGKFDIIHDGHLDHINKAYHLGDWLIIITHPDAIVKMVSGECRVPLWARIQLLEGQLLWLGGKGEVVVNFTDNDGTCTQILEIIKPQIFAKGGDRIFPNMPTPEIEVCKKIGCQIVYGIGDLLNSSSKIKRGLNE